MEHPNYCRNMTKQFSSSLMDRKFNGHRELLSHAIDLGKISTKFMLPNGGLLYDDPEYRALDENDELHLPFDFIALEYARRLYRNEWDGEVQSSKSIIFAREHGEYIAVLPVSYIDSYGIWAPMPEAYIPKIGYFDRGQVIDGRPAIKITMSDSRIFPSDYSDELGVFMCFLNVLNCGNVHIEKSNPKKGSKKVKAAIPFDTYHVLTIDTHRKAEEESVGMFCSHRSPREHLRRGHIRRLSDGRRIWVNAAIVGSGKGAGVVTKDYAIVAAA